MCFKKVENAVNLDRQTCCNRRPLFHRFWSFFVLSKQSIPKRKDRY